MRAEPAVQRWPDWQSTAIRAPKLGARASAKLQAERGRLCKPEASEDLSHRSQLSGSRNTMHDFVAPEVIDEGVPRLHRVHDRLRRRRFEQCAQFHEVMAGAARVKAVERNEIFFAAIKWASVLHCHRGDFAIPT